MSAMNIQAERSLIIEQINQISDIELIKAIKSMLAFAKGKQQSDYIIPEKHKALVRERIKNSKTEDLVNWEDAKDSFSL